MKKFLSLFDFRYVVGSKQSWLFAYMFVYFIYALTTGMEDPLLAVSILIFALAPLKPAFLMFVFYLLWEYVTTFSSGVTVVLIMQLLMVAKMFLQKGFFRGSVGKIHRQSILLQNGLLFYMVIIGIASFLVSRSMTGLSFIFKVLITYYSISYLYDARSFDKLLRAILQILMFSALIATIYGYFHDTALDRWISDMYSTVSQLYGTLGTTRMAFFYLTSVAFFLYYVENRIVQAIGIVLFTVLILMTVSLTAIGLYVMVIGIYMQSKRSILNKVKWGIALFLVVVMTFPIWSKFETIKPIMYRIETSAYLYKTGDIDAATTGRSDLQEIYLSDLKNENALTTIFGNAQTAISLTDTEKYSHNTYIDILFFFGILGLLLLALYQGKKFLLIRGQPYFYPLLTVKAILLVGASTVSVMTASYFVILIFI